MKQQILKYVVLSFSFCSFLISSGLKAQEAVIRIIDKKTSEPIVYANICFEGLEGGKICYMVTNDQGEISNTAQSRSAIAVSFVGYNTLRDTVMPGESRTLFLEPAILNMEGVVVTGQYTPERSDKSIYKIRVIGAEEIESQAAVNLQEVLSTQLNIKMTHDAALGTKMKLQGIGGENVKILVDGVPVIGRMNGDIDLSQITTSNVERIEMVEGPMSVNYGTNALAGVINLITRDNVSDKVDARLNGYAESVGQYNVDGSVGVYKGKNTFLVNGGRNFFDGFSTNDTSRYQQWKPKEQIFGEFKYKRRIGNTNLRISTRYFDEYVLDKGTPQIDADTAAGYYFYKARDGHYYTNRWDNSISWTGLIGSEKYIDLMAAYSYYSRERETTIKNLATLDEQPSGSASDYDTTTFGSWTFRGTLSRFRMDTVTFNYQTGFDINIENGEGAKIDGGSAGIQDYAVFGSVKYRPWQNLTLQPGLRIAYNSKYDAPLTPSINVLYQISEKWTARASYGRGFRAPSLKELYLDFVDLNHKIYGSDSLKAENSNSYQLSFGFHRQTEKVAFKIEPDFFYNSMRDKIDLLPKTVVGNNNDTTEVWVYTNADEFKTYGGRINITYRHKGVFSLGFGVAYIGIYNNYAESAETDPGYYYYPEFALNAAYDNRFTGIRLGVVYKFTGEVTRDRLTADDMVEKYTEESYSMLDLNLSKNFLNDRIMLSVGAKNLFDITDIKTSGGGGGSVHGSGGASMPIAWGRSFFAGLKFKLSK
ncbi:MAG: TonB-dependent receptor [Bacteroidales bacterium]|nr:TonB-dependent receptor [Bacteroidales bacterium]